MGIAFDVIGVMGFILSLTLAIIEIMRNRRKLSLSDASFLYVDCKLYHWILLDVDVSNGSALPISIKRVGLLTPHRHLCSLMEKQSPFVEYKGNPYATAAFTPSVLPVDLEPFSSRRLKLALIPDPESLLLLRLPVADSHTDIVSIRDSHRNQQLQHQFHQKSYNRRHRFHLRLYTTRGPVDVHISARRKQLARLCDALIHGIPYRYPSKTR